MAVRLALAGFDTSVVARGPTLSAVRADGIRLSSGERAPVRVSDRPEELGPQDLVILAVKSPALPSVAPLVAPMLVEDGVILPAMNGVPWWFMAGRSLRSVDRDEVLAKALPRERVLGCVVHLASTLEAPGVVRHTMGNRLIVGEPDSGVSGRAGAVVAALASAGFDAELSPDVRTDIWYKLWGNVTMNPVSALTGATADRVLDDPLVRQFCLAVMNEAALVGERIGCCIAESGEDRIAVTRQLGAFKTSMLQDVESGRPVELDALVGAVREIAEIVEVSTPALDTLFGLTRLSARVRGLYPDVPR
jgi:2-dehydropantoate 2-reductase